MEFDLTEGKAILRRTPATLDAQLRGLPDAWARAVEGPDTWSAYDIVGHLIHGEETDWIPRARIILEHGEARAFDPFDRTAMFEQSKGKSLEELLDEFAALRARSLEELDGLQVTPDRLGLGGTHPELGRVTLGQLLATWVAHDLGHLAQVSRVLARQYAEEVGPWRAYLPILGRTG